MIAVNNLIQVYYNANDCIHPVEPIEFDYII